MVFGTGAVPKLLSEVTRERRVVCQVVGGQAGSWGIGTSLARDAVCYEPSAHGFDMLQGKGWKIEKEPGGPVRLHVDGWPEFVVDRNAMRIELPAGFIEELLAKRAPENARVR